jgi:hypothetical protein
MLLTIKQQLMTSTRNIIAGLGGAVALNLLHQAFAKKDKDAPRLDLVGEEAVQKTLEATGEPKIESKQNLFATALGADLVSNALYFSMIGVGDNKNAWSKAIGLGLTGGTGAVTLPKMLGLNPTPVAKSTKTKSMTVGYYLFGALVTAGILKFMDSRNILVS